MAFSPRWLPKSWIRLSRLETLEDRRLLASFQRLGDLDGGVFSSSAVDLSADGSVVVGHSSSADGPDGEAFRWTSTGMEPLGDLENGLFQSSARGVSADGSVVVGEGWSVDIEDLETPTREAFRWTESIGMQGLGHLWAGNLFVDDSLATDVSADGSLVVGQSYSLAPAEDGSLVHVVEAFRTTAPHLMEGLGDLEGGGFFSGALGLSDDGSVIVGMGTNDLGFRAVRWTTTGPEDLGDLAGGESESMAFAASADGSVVVGYSISTHGYEAFRWTAAEQQMIGLGDLSDGGFDSVALGVSADGSVIVGAGESADGYEAFRWSQLRGMESIRALLVKAGVDMTGWQLTSATAVSADGNVVVGTGINPSGEEEAWRAVLGGLSNFTNTDEIEILSVDLEGGIPTELAFYTSADGKFDKDDDEQLLRVSLSTIGTSDFLVDIVNDQGVRRLTLNPNTVDGTALKNALEDADVATIFAVADPDGDRQSFAPFRGFYRATDEPLAVLRTGPDSKDTVAINMNLLSFTANTADDTLINSKSTSRESIKDLLVVTGELDDEIRAETAKEFALIVMAGSGDDKIDSGGGDDVLDGGPGKDTYRFPVTAGGHDRIREEGEGEDQVDHLDFSLFSQEIDLALDHSARQTVTDGVLALTLETPALLEDVTGSDFDDFVRGNEVINRLIGLKGNDVLVGLGGGASGSGQGDTLNGDSGFDILLGDGFNLTPVAWGTLYTDFTKFVKGDGDDEEVQATLHLSLALTPTGDGGDTINGGDDDDVIIGGAGDDTITAGGGKALIFGDAFHISAGFDLEFSASFDDVSKVSILFVPELDFGHSGNGIDTITSGTDNSLVIGGDGDDIITGGDGDIEILLGNKGDDSIDGKNGLNVIIGGEGGEKLLRGGDNVNFILGDWIQFKAGSSPVTLSATELKPLADLISGLEFAGTASDGDKKIEGGAGPNFIFGGGGDDTITGGNGALDVLFGNDGEDTIDGKNGFNFIFGGNGGTIEKPEMLTGGDDVDVILGDSLAFTSSVAKPDLTGKPVEEAVALLSSLYSSIELSGTGVDHIETKGGLNLAIGGDGNDKITGGDGAVDVLLGNDGEDEIFGKNGFNFIVGGDGADPKLNGGDGFDIIIGDSLGSNNDDEDDEDFVVTPPAPGALGSAVDVLKELAALFKANEVSPESYQDTAFGFVIKGTGNDVIDGGDGVNLLFGGAGHDTLTGGSESDVIYGGVGSDTLNGMSGVDLLVGGWDNDNLCGGGAWNSESSKCQGTDSSANFLFGDVVTVNVKWDLSGLLEGDFTSVLFPKIDIKLLGNGADHIYGGEQFDLIVGGNGADRIWGQNDPDLGCDGSETCSNNNIVFGDDFSLVENVVNFFGIITSPVGATKEVIKGIATALLDLFEDSEGDSVDNGDEYQGGGGYDFVFGGDGNDTLRGAGGNDLLIGGFGDDLIYLGDGKPEEPFKLFFGLITLDEFGWGGKGNDTFYGGAGNDALMSDEGIDTFYGGDGEDLLAGGGDDDVLFGENGNDWLYGEDGNDILDGGPGADKLFGGPGNDAFISDFEDEIDDPIDRLPGDTNLDGRVDLVDLNNVRNNFGAVGTGVLGDANDDDRVDLQDLNAVRNNFGASGSGASALRQRVELAIAVNREQSVPKQSRATVNTERIEGQVDDVVFGVDCGLYERPMSVVDSQLARVIRRRLIRTA